MKCPACSKTINVLVGLGELQKRLVWMCPFCSGKINPLTALQELRNIYAGRDRTLIIKDRFPRLFSLGYNDPRWKLLARARKELDGNRCTRCASELTLQVHHLRYGEGMPGAPQNSPAASYSSRPTARLNHAPRFST
jgi:hypothetical protein